VTALNASGRLDEGDKEKYQLLCFAMKSSVEGMLLLDEDMRIAKANPAAAEILGIPVQELKGEDFLDSRVVLTREDGSAIPEDERPSVIARRSGEAVQPVVIRVRNTKRNRDSWIEVSAIPSGGRIEGERSYTLVTLNDITGRIKAQDKLTQKIQVLNAINDYSMRLGDLPLEDIYPTIARAALDIFGAGAASIAIYNAERKALILKEIALSEDLAKGVQKLIGRSIVKGLAAPVADEDYRTMMELKIGVASNIHEFSFGKIPVAISDAIEKALGIGWFRGLVLSSNGLLFGGLGLAGFRDQAAPETDELRVFAEITANAIKRKQAEGEVKSLLEEKDLLLREVHHRIKNNMNTMISLLSLQARATKDAEAIASLEDAMGRLQSMSTLYNKLFCAEDLREMSLREYLPALAREIVAMFPNGDKIATEARVDDVRLDIKRLSLLGIIANEIIANAMKHAFEGRERGKITVAARLKANRVELRIGDDGIGIPETVSLENSTGFGLGLVRILAKQLDASVSIERRKGSRFIIEFERE
jgi:PAS domain S-box-containing protein